MWIKPRWRHCVALVRFSIRFLNGCDAGNYANISPVMDVLFGTYCCPDGEPESFGVKEPMPRGYLGQMVYPFYNWSRVKKGPQRVQDVVDEEPQGDSGLRGLRTRTANTVPRATIAQEFGSGTGVSKNAIPFE